MNIGLTGGIGCGKTTISDFLKTQNVRVVDADVIARKILQPNTPAFREVVAFFGEKILLENGELNRSALRSHVFHNPEALQKLNAITHPRIRQALLMELTQSNSSTYQVLSAPLLIENNLLDLVHAVVIVDVDEKTQLERVAKRDGSDILTIKKIIQNQTTRNERLRIANFIIDNNGTTTQAIQQTLLLHYQLTKLMEATL